MGNCEFAALWGDGLKPVACWNTHRLSGSKADQQVRSTYRSYRIQTSKTTAFLPGKCRKIPSQFNGISAFRLVFQVAGALQNQGVPQLLSPLQRLRLDLRKRCSTGMTFHGDSKNSTHFFPQWKSWSWSFFVFLVEFPQWKLNDLDSGLDVFFFRMIFLQTSISFIQFMAQEAVVDTIAAWIKHIQILLSGLQLHLYQVANLYQHVDRLPVQSNSALSKQFKIQPVSGFPKCHASPPAFCTVPAITWRFSLSNKVTIQQG